MQRRTFLQACAAGGLGALGGGTALAGGEGYGHGTACGIAAERVDEEFIDGHETASGPVELATHRVVAYDTPLDRRLAVSPDARYVAFAHRKDESFRVMAPGGARHRVPAPEGGVIAFSASSRALLLALDHAGFTRIVLMNPASGANEQWADFQNVRGVAFGAGGVLVTHDLPADGGRAISLVLDRDRTRVLARGLRISVLASRLGRVAFFDGPRAFAMDAGSGSPAELGTLPSDATRAAWGPDGLYAICDSGLYAFDEKRGPVRRIAEAGLHTLLVHPRGVVCASRRRAFLVGRGVQGLPVAARGNLTQVSLIPESDELLVVRGPSVLRFDPVRHTSRLVARGRPGLRLRGAALGRGVITWCSRTLEVSDGGGCREVLPPREYLVD